MGSGTADKVRGRIKKGLGDLADDPGLRREGEIDETAGEVKDGIGRGVDKVKKRLKKR